LSSGLLLSAAWPVSPLTILIFTGFVPLFWLEEQSASGLKFFGWTYLTLLIWNTASTWWMCNSTIPGGIAAILANSLLMCIPWMGFYNIKKRMGTWIGYPSLVFFWLCFEYVHLNWELSWPWLTLGNVFATHPGWVRWYAYTGTSGGSLWVIVINLLVFAILGRISGNSGFPTRLSIVLMLSLLFPFLFSAWLGNHSDSLTPEPAPQKQVLNIVLIQPNIDPWDEKFVAGKEEAQLQKLLRLSESQIDTETALVVWPETAIPIQINEDSAKSSPYLAPLWNFLRMHPRVNLLTGMEGFRILDQKDKTEYSERIPGTDKYVDSYNSAVLFDSSSYMVYHKSKLVPGVEVLPSFLHFLDKWFEKFGGTTGGYTPQDQRTVLNTYNHTYAIAPAVCYESIYGEFMSKYIRNGADIIAIITNDGWWGNTAGFKQHESYARLRAVETGHWVVRSANTGISCFIDPSGRVLDAQPWDKETAIKRSIPLAKSQPTFYVVHGDIISKSGTALAILVFIFNIGFIIRKKRRVG
jgi:apolipoprotein N-acyltransferase